MNSSKVPVTVIVPTYNRGPLIKQSIDSILGQTWLPQEIIVVVDGSTDETVNVLAMYADRIRVVSKPNGGKSSALNLGLSLANQPFIWIFDDDDIACPDALEHLYSTLSNTPEAGLSYGMLDRFYGDWPGEVTEPWLCYSSSDRVALYIKLMQDFFIWQGSMLVRKECYDSVGEFDERFHRSQDYQMLLRLVRRFEAVVVPRIIFHQRHHDGERGPSHARFNAQQADKVWTHFDHMMFDEIYERHGLEEFCSPSVDGPLDPRTEFTALLQRGAIMARKGLWERATSDMEKAAGLASRIHGLVLKEQELTALRAVFEHGARSQFGSRAEAARFFGAIRRFKPSTANKIIGNLLLPVTNRAKMWRQRPRKLQEARQLFYLFPNLLRPATMPEYLAARQTEYRLFKLDVVTAAEKAEAKDTLHLAGSAGVHVPLIANLPQQHLVKD